MQLKLLPQVPPQEFGVPKGGVPVGVDVGVPVPEGVVVGVEVGVPVGVDVEIVRVNEREQEGAGAGVATSCAFGLLEGAAGEMDACLSW